MGRDAATTPSRGRIRVVLGGDGAGSHRALQASFGGAAVARVLRSELPDLQVVVLTRCDSPPALTH